MRQCVEHGGESWVFWFADYDQPFVSAFSWPQPTKVFVFAPFVFLVVVFIHQSYTNVFGQNAVEESLVDQVVPSLETFVGSHCRLQPTTPSAHSGPKMTKPTQVSEWVLVIRKGDRSRALQAKIVSRYQPPWLQPTVGLQVLFKGRVTPRAVMLVSCHRRE